MCLCFVDLVIAESLSTIIQEYIFMMRPTDGYAMYDVVPPSGLKLDSPGLEREAAAT
jgi:hypothetical protein